MEVAADIANITAYEGNPTPLRTSYCLRCGASVHVAASTYSGGCVVLDVTPGEGGGFEVDFVKGVCRSVPKSETKTRKADRRKLYFHHRCDRAAEQDAFAA